MNTKKIIEVKELIKTYKKSEVNAVDGISFYVEEGAFFSLLGPNGAGKTTTISILTTILSKSSGEVKIDGLDVEKAASKVRQRIGVIFQNPSLDANLTAEENVRFHCNLYGLFPYRPSYKLMPQDYQDKIEELAQVLDLKKDIHRSVKSLSGGMKRKLEIIRSLTHQPKVLFLDEPTTGLDPVSRQNLWKYLQKIRHQTKTTIFLTTHYLEEAEASDYICILNNGKIVCQGTPQEIKNTLIEKYMIIDASDRKTLVEELESRSINYRGKGPFKIPLKNGGAQQTIQQIRTKLSTLEIHNPSLEDAYVRIIEG